MSKPVILKISESANQTPSAASSQTDVNKNLNQNVDLPKNFNTQDSSHNAAKANNSNSKPVIFLIAGRTGGPFFPLPTIANNLPEFGPVYIGVKNSFEETASKKQSFRLEFLPEVRLTLLSFKNLTWLYRLSKGWDFLKQFGLLIWSFILCLRLLLKYKPKMVYSTGSFLSVPMFFAAEVTNFLKLTQTKKVIHQQDPMPGLANNLTIRTADLVTCTFSYTKTSYPKFAQAKIIPNPIEPDLYNLPKAEALFRISQITPDLGKFLNTNLNQPLFLIFGGGSGAEAINLWVLENLESLLKDFRIAHLTGVLQNKDFTTVSRVGYLQVKDLDFFTEMPLILNIADIVLCRSGLGSITQLSYLRKPAYLVPLPDSHQEINALVVKDMFYILHQDNIKNWVQVIQTTYPDYFSNLPYPEAPEIQADLQTYYRDLQNLIGS